MVLIMKIIDFIYPRNLLASQKRNLIASIELLHINSYEKELKKPD